VRDKVDTLDLLILQPTSFCNIDCSYCYLPARNDRQRMSFETVKAVCRALIERDLVNKTLSVVWHAGEPLVMPVSFYEEAITYMRSMLAPADLSFSLQTNGTLINDDWCEKFIKHNISVGVSIDGPSAYHNMHRRHRNGTGTFDQVLSGVGKLKEHSIPFSVICVLTKDSIDDPHGLFDFFEYLGPRDICFNIDEKDGINSKSSFATEASLDSFRRFYLNYFDLARVHKSKIRIRELERGLRFIVEDRALEYNSEVRPLGIITIGHDGTVSTFSPELHGLETDAYGKFVFGNVHSPDSITQMMQSDVFQRVWDDITSGVEACRRECSFFDVCGGGSPANKLAENSSFASTRSVACAFGVRGLAAATIDHVRTAAQFQE
jgi:uncharacterized protein